MYELSLDGICVSWHLSFRVVMSSNSQKCESCSEYEKSYQRNYVMIVARKTLAWQLSMVTIRYGQAHPFMVATVADSNKRWCTARWVGAVALHRVAALVRMHVPTEYNIHAVLCPKWFI